MIEVFIKIYVPHITQINFLLLTPVPQTIIVFIIFYILQILQPLCYRYCGHKYKLTVSQY